MCLSERGPDRTEKAKAKKRNERKKKKKKRKMSNAAPPVNIRNVRAQRTFLTTFILSGEQ